MFAAVFRAGRVWFAAWLRIQPEFATGAVELNESFLLFEFDPAFGIAAGKTGRPFGIIDANVAPKLIPIERGARIRGIRPLELYGLLEQLSYVGRSVGVQVLGAPEGAPLNLSYAAGYFNGALTEAGLEGADIEQVAGRVTVRPAEVLQIGAALSSRPFRCRDSTDCFMGDDERGAQYTLDAQYGEFGRTGLYLLGEWSAGTFDPFTDTDYRGAQVWAAYRTPAVSERLTGLQPLVRVSYGDLDDGSPLAAGSTGMLVTPGFNVYGGRLNRIMLNYDIWMPDEGDTEGSFKLQFQLAF